jgi:transketolase
MEFIGVNDSFGESGTPDQLMEKYGLKSKNIIAAAKRLMEE